MTIKRKGSKKKLRTVKKLGKAKNFLRRTGRRAQASLKATRKRTNKIVKTIKKVIRMEIEPVP